MSEDELIEEVDEEVTELADDEVVLPDDGTAEEHLPNLVSGFAHVEFCEEHGGRVIASLMTDNPEPKARFRTYHPAVLPEMVETGSVVMILGEIAEDEIWLPARTNGRMVPNGGSIAGAEVTTHFIQVNEVTVMEDMPEDFIARIHMYLETRLMELVGKGGSDRKNQQRAQRQQGRRGRRRQSNAEGVFNKELEEMNFRPSELVHYAGVTGNGTVIRVEAFYSDYFNRSSLEQNVRLFLDIVPQWHNDVEGTVEVISDATGRPMKAKMKVRGRMSSLQVIVHPHTMRAVIATRILDDTLASSEAEQLEEVVEDLAGVRGHASRIAGIGR